MKLTQKKTSSITAYFSFLSLFFICIWIPTKTYGHANGSVKIDVKLQDSSIIAYVDVNEEDIFRATYPLDKKKITEEDSLLFHKLSFLYLRDRLITKINYKPQTLSFQLDDIVYSTGKDGRPVMIFTLHGSLSKGLDEIKKIQLNSSLFPEFGGQAIANMNLHIRDTLVQQDYLLTDEFLTWTPYESSKKDGEIFALLKSLRKFLYLGFVHIIPLGLDHILFVLGLFFFTTRWKPLLAQVTAFTIAHSLTLGMSMLNVFSLPGSVIEPLIALSISYVAIENIFFNKKKNSEKWRWFMVFIFGLLHGMGFAGVLKDLQVPQDQFLSCLFFFNIGLEGGQLLVLLGAAILTGWFWKKTWYRVAIAIPASVFIGLVGLYWTFERILG